MVGQGTSDASTEEKDAHSHDLSNNHPQSWSVGSLGGDTELANKSVIGSLVLGVPDIGAGSEGDVVGNSVCNGSLCLELQSLSISLVHALSCKELDSLSATSNDGWHGGDESKSKQVVACSGQVEVCWDIGGDGCWKVTLDSVEDVEAVGEGEEGDWEVDCGWVDWTVALFSGDAYASFGKTYGILTVCGWLLIEKDELPIARVIVIVRSSIRRSNKPVHSVSENAMLSSDNGQYA